MKTKLLYILISSENDIYLEQAYISISSVRHHMGANVIICLLMDNYTKNSLKDGREQIVELVDELVSVDVDRAFSQQQRSRFLKTSARNIISGDFLFIDCDTIILKSLEDIDNVTANLAAVKDSHTDFLHSPYREMCINHCRKFDVDVSKIDSYFNSGVLLVKDTRETRIFYQHWHNNWIKGYQLGVNMDQPAFNFTNISMGCFIKELNDIWNCQYIHGIRFLNKAKILHYLCTNKLAENDTASFLLRDESVLKCLKKNYIITPEIKQCFEDPFLGIPPLTHLLAGKSVGLLSTNQWKMFFSTYKTPYFKLYFYLGRIINKYRKIFRNETI